MKKLIQKITWKKMLAGMFLLGCFGVGAYNLYIYQTRTWLDEVFAFFS
jgi:hypothetical protein